MDTIKPRFTATATATVGRNGPTATSNGMIFVDLSVPKAMGGPGKPGTVTPEHLFAAGYAACFGGALDFVAKQHKQDASKARGTCAVSICVEPSLLCCNIHRRWVIAGIPAPPIGPNAITPGAPLAAGRKIG